MKQPADGDLAAGAGERRQPKETLSWLRYEDKFRVAAGGAERLQEQLPDQRRWQVPAHEIESPRERAPSGKPKTSA
jgi:hypothetical protein